MAQERTAQPAGHAGGQQEGGQQAPEPGASQDGEESVPTSHSYNQPRDEPIPASHDDDGRPEPGEQSPTGADRAGGAAS
jgi:hypothetical protein